MWTCVMKKMTFLLPVMTSDREISHLCSQRSSLMLEPTMLKVLKNCRCCDARI